jgi:hypothetical protein
MFEQIGFWIGGAALLALAFRLVHKEKYAFAVFVLIAALVGFLMSASWFQALMRTQIIAIMTNKLTDYGRRLDEFNTTTVNIKTELSDQQSQLTKQQQKLGEQQAALGKVQSDIETQQSSLFSNYLRSATMQRELALVQTSITNQQNELQDVQFLVNNLFSKAQFETISVTDTNRVAIQTFTNGVSRVLFKLKRAAVPKSIQAVARNIGLFGPTPLIPMDHVEQNVVGTHFEGGLGSRGEIDFQYVEDTRKTNLIQKIEFRGNVFFLDGRGTVFR